MRAISRLGAAGIALTFSLATSVQPAVAECQVLMASTSWSGTLPSNGVWHFRQGDSVAIYAVAPKLQTHLDVVGYAFGIGVPVWHSDFATTRTFESGTVMVSDFSAFSRTATVDIDTNNCHLAATVVVDDVSALLTVAGGAGAIVALVALLLLGLLARRRPSVGGRLLAALLGALFGLGIGVLAQETGIIPAKSLIGIAVPVVAVLLAAAIPGALYRPIPATPATSPVPEREAVPAGL
jgi:hypothetical protein